MKTVILTDSASEMEPQEGLDVIQLKVRFGLDGFEGDNHTFYERLAASKDIPQTSQASPGEWRAAMEAALEKGEELLVITVGSKFSGTYQSALLAAEGMDNVHIVDSMNASLAQNILVRRALQLVQEGKGAAGIKEILDAEKQDLCLVVLLETLEYLKKGGRISATAAVAGTLMNIKPMIGVENGEVVMLGKARGLKKGGTLLTEQAKEAGIDYERPYIAGWTGTDKANLDKYMEEHRDVWEHDGILPPEVQAGPIIGTHVGPGCLAAAWFRKKQKA